MHSPTRPTTSLEEQAQPLGQGDVSNPLALNALAVQVQQLSESQSSSQQQMQQMYVAQQICPTTDAGPALPFTAAHPASRPSPLNQPQPGPLQPQPTFLQLQPSTAPQQHL